MQVIFDITAIFQKDTGHYLYKRLPSGHKISQSNQMESNLSIHESIEAQYAPPISERSLSERPQQRKQSSKKL